MTTLAITVLLASLAGSLHCAGMCGAFVAFAVGSSARCSRLKTQCAYHGGRLVTYSALGAVAGVLGAGVDLAGSLGGMHRFAAILSAVFVVAFAAVGIAHLHKGKRLNIRMPRPVHRMLERGHRFAMKCDPVTRALLIGLMTTLLPCGWLWAFVLVAAGTGNPMSGAVVMAAFWLGTVPVLAFIGAGVRLLTGRLANYVPALAILAIASVAMVSVFNRAFISLDGMPGAARADTLTEQVESIDAEQLPCCHAD